MADENSLLGTTGKEAIPFEYQVEEQKLARRRALAQAMMARGMQAPPAPMMFGNRMARPGIAPHLVNALAMFLGQKDLGVADEQSAALSQRMGADRAGEFSKVQQLMQGQPRAPIPIAAGLEDPPGTAYDAGVKPDIAGALVAARQARFPEVRQWGQQVEKDRNTKLIEIAKLIGNNAGAQYLNQGNPDAAVPPVVPGQVEYGQMPSGAGTAITRNEKGIPTVRIENLPSRVSAEARTSSTADIENEKAAIDQLAASRKEVKDLPLNLQNYRRIAELLDKGADVGGGGTFRQSMRQFGAAFGQTVPEGGLTTEMKMKLGEKVLENARKLAPVTANDIEVLRELYGSIDTDPRALKEINAMMLAKTLMTIDIHNESVEKARAVTSGTPAKYNVYSVDKPSRIDKASGALYGRAFQLMKEAGHDMSGYMFDDQPVNKIKLNFDFQSPTNKQLVPPMPAGIWRLP